MAVAIKTNSHDTDSCSTQTLLLILPEHQRRRRKKYYNMVTWMNNTYAVFSFALFAYIPIVAGSELVSIL